MGPAHRSRALPPSSPRSSEGWLRRDGVSPSIDRLSLAVIGAGEVQAIEQHHGEPSTRRVSFCQKCRRRRYRIVTKGLSDRVCLVPRNTGTVSSKVNDFTIACVSVLYFRKCGDAMCASYAFESAYISKSRIRAG